MDVLEQCVDVLEQRVDVLEQRVDVLEQRVDTLEQCECLQHIHTLQYVVCAVASNRQLNPFLQITDVS